jgi:hypothetical protein
MNIEAIEKTFNCGENASLSFSNILGKVKIKAGDDNVIVVRAEKILNSGDTDNTLIELSQDNEGKVIVHTRYDHSGFRLFSRFGPCKVIYDVAVPRNCDLKVRGVSNAANIEGISGKMDISTVSGELTLNSLYGALKMKSVSGDVQADQVSAPTRIETVSGDFRLMQSNFPSLRAKTVSGDLTLETPLGDGPYDFNSVSGDIKVGVTQLTGVTVNSSSLSGDLRISAPLSSSNQSRNHHRAEIMGGGVEIRHKSVSGDFYFASAEAIEDLKELPPPISDQVEILSHAEILESIERGELSVDEAVGILENG